MKNSLNIKFVKNKILPKNNQENEIYISKKRNNIQKFYFERAYELFNKMNYKEIYVCGLGACVNHAVKVALTIIDGLNNISIENVETKSINHTDEYIDTSNDVR